MVNMQVTKNIFKIHILFYITGLICFITGFFKNFIIFTSIILIHELGHITSALILKWNIEKVIILPFGGITIFNERIDKSLLEEFIIAIMGPIFQIIFMIIFKENTLFYNYNKIILFFNLLPIFPLDGSKILNIFLNKFICFSYSHVLTLIISILISISLIFYENSLVFLLIIFFIIKEVIIDMYKHNYYMNKFFLEKYLYNDVYKKRKIIKNINNMYKQTNHLIKKNNKYYKEKEIISDMFKNM